eukprot:TRINITY_DN19201_c0_g1_i1.p1 TRINITY_DN19201_c0_g1~~TRINITY_DN19201_c0_g1_i1.p1  ORF type:complete len:361 (-),score=47.66 TRINITY_DN19201_c0_g1_i1:321-1349(-)
MDAQSPLRGLVYGGLSCAVADAVTIPLDVLKVRMQLQGQGGHEPLYKNSLDAVVKITKAEGPLAWTKGLAPAVYRQLSYGSLRFGLYAKCKELYGAPTPSSSSRPKNEEASSVGAAPLRKTLAAATAGGIAAFVCTPIDLIKVRMMADGMLPAANAPPSYRGVAHAATDIWRREGPRGLYKGVWPTTNRAAAVNMVEIASYDEIKCFLMRHGAADGAQLHFTSAMVAGFFSTAVSCPFDVIKSRLMSQPFDAQGHGLHYSGMLDCCMKSLRTEGWRFMYRGFWPAYLNKGPTVVIMYMLFEQLRIHGDRWLDSLSASSRATSANAEEEQPPNSVAFARRAAV